MSRSSTCSFSLPLCPSPLPICFALSAPSEIFVHGDLQWDVFQVIISRSTTPDLIKIGMKLQEFFTQQFDTSKRALSTWGPGPYLPPKTPVINTEKGAAELCKRALGDAGVSGRGGVEASRRCVTLPVPQTWMQPITATGPGC